MYMIPLILVLLKLNDMKNIWSVSYNSFSVADDDAAAVLCQVSPESIAYYQEKDE